MCNWPCIQFKRIKMVKLAVDLNGFRIPNPIMTASGTCGYGEELSDFFDIRELGALVVKGTTLEPREGNDYPRMAETASGMLNSVGLQNKGVDHFISDIYPRIKKMNKNLIVNVSGSVLEDYLAVVEKLNDLEYVRAVEVNISCPNIKEGGLAFGTSPRNAALVTGAVRDHYKKHVMVKLSPNVTNIVEIARAVEDAGADSLSLINTLLGMAIDAHSRKPKLATVTGGLSGPAIKPVALRMVWQVAQNTHIPVIGMGGIMNSDDAIEFFLAGASAIQIGTALFIDPQSPVKIRAGIEKYLEEHGFTSIYDIIGALEIQ
jgi:dihydroorotate dehydrogenase (NAD+) catalytic subunit